MGIKPVGPRLKINLYKKPGPLRESLTSRPAFLGSARLGAVKQNTLEYIHETKVYNACNAATSKLSAISMSVTVGVKETLKDQTTQAFLLGASTAALLVGGGFSIGDSTWDIMDTFRDHFGLLTSLNTDPLSFTNLVDFFNKENVVNALGKIVSTASLTFLGLSLLGRYVNNNQYLTNKLADIFRRLTPAALIIPTLLIIGELRPLFGFEFNDTTSFFHATEFFRDGYAAYNMFKELVVSPFTEGGRQLSKNADLYVALFLTACTSLWMTARDQIKKIDPEHKPSRAAFWTFCAKAGWATPALGFAALTALGTLHDSIYYNMFSPWRESYKQLLFDGIALAVLYNTYNRIASSLDNRFNQIYPASKSAVATIIFLARNTFAANYLYFAVRLPLISALLANIATLWLYGDAWGIPLKLALFTLTSVATIKYLGADLHTPASAMGATNDAEKSLNTFDRPLTDQEQEKISRNKNVLLIIAVASMDSKSTIQAMPFRVLLNSHPNTEIKYLVELWAHQNLGPCTEARGAEELLEKNREIQAEMRNVFYDKYLKMIYEYKPADLRAHYLSLAGAFDQAGKMLADEEGQHSILARIRDLEIESYRRTLSEEEKADQWIDIEEPPPQPWRGSLDQALRILGGNFSDKARDTTRRANAHEVSMLSYDELMVNFELFIDLYSASLKMLLRHTKKGDDRTFNKITNVSKLHTRTDDNTYDTWVLTPSATGVTLDIPEIPGRYIVIRNPERVDRRPVAMQKVEITEGLKAFVKENKHKFYVSKHGILVTHGFITEIEEKELKRNLPGQDLDAFISASRDKENLKKYSPFVLIDRKEVPEELKTSTSWDPKLYQINNQPDDFDKKAMGMAMPFLGNRKIKVYPWHSEDVAPPPVGYVNGEGKNIPLSEPEKVYTTDKGPLKGVKVFVAGEKKSEKNLKAFILMHDKWAQGQYGKNYQPWIDKKRGSSFSVGEFKDKLTIKGLCEAINGDSYSIALGSSDNTIERLNELLQKPDFYDVWLKKDKKIKLSKRIEKLRDATKPYRNKKFTELLDSQQTNIKDLNRLLIETTYPQTCPKSQKRKNAMGWSDTPNFNVYLGKLSGTEEVVSGTNDEEHVWFNLRHFQKLLAQGLLSSTLAIPMYYPEERVFPVPRNEVPKRAPERVDTAFLVKEIEGK